MIRKLKKDEEPLLEELLYHAVFVPPGESPPARDVIYIPEVYRYIENWGRPGDVCLVSELDGVITGMAWARWFAHDQKSYGFVDEDTPEIAIALYPQYRGCGVGTQLLRELLRRLGDGNVEEENAAQDKAKPRDIDDHTISITDTRKNTQWVSLSVDKRNPAVRLYRRLGFEILQEHGTEYVMVKVLVSKK